MANISLVFDIVIFWFIIEFITGDVIPSLRRRGARIKPMDRGSQLLVYLTVYPALALAFVMAIYQIALLPEWTFYPGIVLMLAGILFRQWAVLTLGRYFSDTVGVQKGQKVVDSGPYRYVRHPSYTGILVVFLGIGLALQSWGALLLLLLIFVFVFSYRVHVEETALASELGDAYVRYMKRTKRLIPFVL